jgi:hypothetical protein
LDEAGIPLAKLMDSDGRPSELYRVLSRGGSLGNRGNLADLRPLILQQQRKLIQDEIKQGADQFNSGKLQLTIIFDGTTKVCERYVLLVRFFRDGQVCTRLIAFPALAHSLNATQLQAELIIL